MLLDPSVSQQSYVEDCEVCFNPIEVSFTVDNHLGDSEEAVISFDAQPLGQ
jgi:hypothetical protein